MDKFIIPDSYRSPDRQVSWFSRQFPNTAFYWRLLGVVMQAARLAKKGAYYDEDWVKSSRAIVELLEGVGVLIEIKDISVFSGLNSPCVFVGNHIYDKIGERGRYHIHQHSRV